MKSNNRNKAITFNLMVAKIGMKNVLVIFIYKTSGNSKFLMASQGDADCKNTRINYERFRSNSLPS